MEILKNSVISRNKELKSIDVYNDKGIVNENEKKFFMMNEVGNRVWELIENPIELNHIVDILSQEYNIDKNNCENSILNFLNKLNSVNLIFIE